MLHRITTMPGVVLDTDTARAIIVEREAGSTMVTLTVFDTSAPGCNETLVFLDHRMVAKLMMALGAAGIEL